MNNSTLFRPEALTHRRERLHGEVIVTQPPSLFVLMIILSSIAFGIICFLILGEYARKETVVGYLRPGPGVVKVYSPRIGIVENLNVIAGQFVKKGSLLFSIETKRYGHSEANDIDRELLHLVQQQIEEIQKQIAHTQEMFALQKPHYDHSIILIESEVEALKSQMARQDQLIQLSKKDVEVGNKLRTQGYESKQAYRQRKQTLIRLQQRTHLLYEQITSRERLLGRTELEAIQAPIKLANRISELRQTQTDLLQKKMELSDRRTTQILAPINGYISFVQIAQGRTVSTDLPLLSIVPDGASLIAELFIPSKAIGFVKKNQKVRLLYDAFPYQRFGSYGGVISEVAQTVLSREEINFPALSNNENTDPVFKVTVKLNQQFITAYGKEIKLRPGISLKADIIFDRRALYEWALDPLYSVKGRLL